MTDCYYKVPQVLQSVTVITKWDVTKIKLYTCAGHLDYKSFYYVTSGSIFLIITGKEYFLFKHTKIPFIFMFYDTQYAVQKEFGNNENKFD